MNKFFSLLVFSAGTSFFCVNAEAGDAVLQDPTRPLNFRVAAVEKKQNLSLQAVFISDGQVSKAIIDGHLLSLNEKISGWQLTAIESGSVTLRSGRETRVLYLREALLQ